MRNGPLTCILSILCVSAHGVALKDVHADINVNFSGGSLPSNWFLSIEDDDNGVSYAIADATLWVKIQARQPRPTGTNWDFVGVPAGRPYYRLPQLQDPNLLYLGYAASGVPFTSIGGYNAFTESGGKVSGTGPWVRVRLLNVRAKGQFSVWRNSDAGPVPYMSTSDGITSNDSLWVLAGGHNHYNWGFTLPGTYDVTFQPTAFTRLSNGQAGSPITGQPQTVRFFVEYPVLPISSM